MSPSKLTMAQASDLLSVAWVQQMFIELAIRTRAPNVSPWHPLTDSHGLAPRARKSLEFQVPNATVPYALSL